MSPNEFITIILTATQFFHISVLEELVVGAFLNPSPLCSTCQPASQAEQGGRNSGHNEGDDNKAMDGEMAVTEQRERCNLNSWNGSMYEASLLFPGISEG